MPCTTARPVRRHREEDDLLLPGRPAVCPRASSGGRRPMRLRHAGRLIRILADGARTGGAYTVFEVTLSERPSGLGLHVHREEDEQVTVLEGRLQVTLDHEVHDLGPGEELVLPRGVPHRVEAASDGARYLATCTPSGIETFLRATSQEPDAPDVVGDDMDAHMAAAGLRVVPGGHARG